MFTALVVQADDDGTHDAVRDLVDTVQLSREIGLGLKTNQRVNALRLILDRVRQTALAPVLDLYVRAVRLNERLNLSTTAVAAASSSLGLTMKIVSYLPEIFAIFLAPPFGLLAHIL